MKRDILPFLCLPIALLATPARAFEFDFPWVDVPSSFQITSTSVFDYHDDNVNEFVDDDDYYDLRNRLNLDLSVDRFSFSGRLDTNTFFGAPLPDRNTVNQPYLDRYTPEKLSASYNGRDLKATIGDFYATIGRGLALNIRKTDQLGEDNTLLGGKVSYRLGPFEVMALSGLSNPANMDLFEKTIKDPYDLVSAGRASLRIADTVTVGVHGVGFVFAPLGRNDQSYLLPDYTVIAGARVEVPDLSEVASLYAEINWLGRMPRPGLADDSPDLDHGWAGYLSASFYLGDDWTLVAEAKSYADFYAGTITSEDGARYASSRIQYLRPPTLEPATMEVENNFDLTGGRLQLEYRPGGGDTLLFATYSGFWAEDLANAGDRWIYHTNAGVEQDFWKTGRARLTVGLREEAPQYPGSNRYHLFYFDAVVKVPIGARHSIDLHGTNWMVHKLLGGEALDYLQGEWTLGYAWSPWLSTSAIFGYDTFPSSGDKRQLFLAGSVSINLWGDYLLRVLFGQIRGGPICVDGVCRVLPPFAGVRAELTLRF